MPGRNNRQARLQKAQKATNKDRFAIRKLAIGAVSVMIGVVGVGAANQQTVLADEPAKQSEQQNKAADEQTNTQKPVVKAKTSTTVAPAKMVNEQQPSGQTVTAPAKAKQEQPSKLTSVQKAAGSKEKAKQPVPSPVPKKTSSTAKAAAAKQQSKPKAKEHNVDTVQKFKAEYQQLEAQLPGMSEAERAAALSAFQEKISHLSATDQQLLASLMLPAVSNYDTSKWTLSGTSGEVTIDIPTAVSSVTEADGKSVYLPNTYDFQQDPRYHNVTKVDITRDFAKALTNANLDNLHFDHSHNSKLYAKGSDWSYAFSKNNMPSTASSASWKTFDFGTTSEGGFDTSAIQNMSHMFDHDNYVTSITGLTTWDTSNVTNMSGMFLANSVLSQIDLHGINTSKVTDMTQMFDSCSNMTVAKLSGWDLSSAKKLTAMFHFDQSLQKIDGIEDWSHASGVTNTDYMFFYCTSLPGRMDLSKWRVTGLKTGQCMFAITSLNYINLSHWNLGTIQSSHLPSSSGVGPLARGTFGMFSGLICPAVIVMTDTNMPTDSAQAFQSADFKIQAGIGLTVNQPLVVISNTLAATSLDKSRNDTNYLTLHDPFCIHSADKVVGEPINFLYPSVQALKDEFNRKMALDTDLAVHNREINDIAAWLRTQPGIHSQWPDSLAQIDTLGEMTGSAIDFWINAMNKRDHGDHGAVFNENSLDGMKLIDILRDVTSYYRVKKAIIDINGDEGKKFDGQPAVLDNSKITYQNHGLAGRATNNDFVKAASHLDASDFDWYEGSTLLAGIPSRVGTYTLRLNANGIRKLQTDGGATPTEVARYLTNNPNGTNKLAFPADFLLTGVLHYTIRPAHEEPAEGQVTIKYIDQNGNTIAQGSIPGTEGGTLDPSSYITAHIPTGYEIKTGYPVPTSASVSSTIKVPVVPQNNPGGDDDHTPDKVGAVVIIYKDPAGRVLASYSLSGTEGSTLDPSDFIQTHVPTGYMIAKGYIVPTVAVVSSTIEVPVVPAGGEQPSDNNHQSDNNQPTDDKAQNISHQTQQQHNQKLNQQKRPALVKTNYRYHGSKTRKGNRLPQTNRQAGIGLLGAVLLGAAFC